MEWSGSPRCGQVGRATVVGTLALSGIIAGLLATPTAAQNLIDNGSFEIDGVLPGSRDCCLDLGPLSPASDLLSPWSIGGGGVELRARSWTCPDGAADGRHWVRLGSGGAGGSVEQVFPTTPGRRYVCRFRRWVEAPPGPNPPLQIVGPGFSLSMQLPSDGLACEPPLAGLGSVEFDAIEPSSSIRLLYPGGPPHWNVMIDDVVVVPVEDCDGDGLVDGLAIADGLVDDADHDGTPDRCECRGDVDGDGRIDGVELSLLLGHWGSAIPPTLDADGDGVAGGADLAMVVGRWGDCP